MKPVNLAGVALAAAALQLAAPVRADAPSATPYRPTVSNPAELPAPGYVEAEAGFSRSKGNDGTRQASAPYLIKYAFSEDFGVLLGGDAHIRQKDAEGAVTSGRGDTSITLKHHWKAGEDYALGLEWGAKLDTARTGLGTGYTDYTVNGIYSVDMGDTRIDANLGVTRLGGPSGNQGRNKHAWALSVSRPIAENWGAALEVSGAQRRGATPEASLLAALSWNSSRRVVWDLGWSTALAKASADWAIVGGVTVLYGK